MLTQEQIDRFHRDGFLAIRGLFKGEELEALQNAAHAVAEEGIAGKGEQHLYHASPGGVKTYYRSERMWDRAPVFKAVTVNPTLLACIGQCMGHPFLPVNDSFVCKIPQGNVPVNWHQDPPYGNPRWELTYSIPNFDVDIYLDDSTIENGCVWGIPGHHLVGHVDVKQFTQEQLFSHPQAIPLEMQPGDVLFHGLSAPHGSIGNRTASWRRIFYVHYMACKVLERCYPEFAARSDRGSYERLQPLAAEFLNVRDGLGWDVALDRLMICFDQDGFRFTGQPGTPPHYWGHLQARLSATEIAAKKALR